MGLIVKKVNYVIEQYKKVSIYTPSMYGIMTPSGCFLVYKNYIGDNEMYYCLSFLVDSWLV
jgi:hypothetical protein